VTATPVSPGQAEKNRKEIARAAGEFAAALRRPARKSPGLYDLMVFHGQRAAFRQLETISPADYRYWNGKGWFDRGARYFTDVPVNPVYHAIGVAVEKISARRMEKDSCLVSCGAAMKTVIYYFTGTGNYACRCPGACRRTRRCKTHPAQEGGKPRRDTRWTRTSLVSRSRSIS